ncbi:MULTISPECIES: hypothetical protein [unclassified Lysobacter]|uniref:hypothetical protein n=1 Tax=unclassified Lysobacter TaxID=2635362 RepID=UPI0006F27E52|nr:MULTISPECIES: hypothetical protein [unclassified Lysobacter]KQZ60326.1 hypothetical protein ASD53_04085 [Lysobacter sp. Root559]KRA76801.1 hypothetical protein ASD78_03995 [Lysobacter sp. Root667]KRC38767.1 hypothetical protein ASE10_04385 [Lysobacter sp. Root76]KRD71030.1 hypothetical protein ASE45_04065 [Lysobacter sp. Root96]
MAESKKVAISPEAAAAVARGDLIAAIKLVRDSNGKIELRLAKEAVEAWRDSRPLPSASVIKPASSPGSAPSAHGGLPAAALLALSQGKTIEAIKVLHQSGMDLRTAKERVEAHIHGHAKAAATMRSGNAATTRPITAATVRPPTVQHDDSDRRVVVFALLAVALALIVYVWDAGWL